MNRTRRHRGAVVAATAAAILGGAAVGQATATPQWINGPITNTSGYVVDPFSPTGMRFELLTGQYAGYLGEPDASAPRVGEVFYVHGLVAVVATVSEVPIMTLLFDEQLAPDVRLAISSESPVLCLYYPEVDGPGQPDGANCRQTPEAGLGGGYYFGGRQLAPGEAFEIRVPIRVLQPKSGMATGAGAQFGVHVTPALGSPAIASQYLFVAPAPAGSSPAPGAPGARDTTPPGIAAVRVVVSRRAVRSLQFRLGEAAHVSATLQRRRGRTWRRMRRVLDRNLAAGVRRIRLGRLGPGRYRVTLVLRDAAGNTRTTRRGLTV